MILDSSLNVWVDFLSKGPTCECVCFHLHIFLCNCYPLQTPTAVALHNSDHQPFNDSRQTAHSILSTLIINGEIQKSNSFPWMDVSLPLIADFIYLLIFLTRKGSPVKTCCPTWQKGVKCRFPRCWRARAAFTDAKTEWHDDLEVI